MDWNGIREYGDRRIPLVLSADLEVNLSAAGLSREEWRAACLTELELSLRTYAIRLATEFSRARRALGKLTIPVRSDQLLPWLPQPLGEPRPVVFSTGIDPLADRFLLGTALTGQRLERSIEIARFSIGCYEQLPTQPITLHLEALDLLEGSLKGTAKVILHITVATAELALATFASPPGQALYDDWRTEQRIERVAENQDCHLQAHWQIDLAALEQLGMQSLNYGELGLNDAEHALRVCNVQLVLALTIGRPSLIDGKAGRETKAALTQYAESHGVNPADISNPELRRLLLRDLRTIRYQ